MAYLGSFGSNSNKTSGTTIAITAASTIPAGTWLVLGIVCDNAAAATPTISSVSTSGGGTWTSLGSATSGATATAGAGIFLYAYRTLTTADITSGTTITTVTFSTATVAKAVEVWGFDFVTDSLRNTVATGTSTAGTPTATTTGTALVAGDLVIGIIGGENNAVPTGDADTLNGSWSTIDGVATTGANANTNVALGMQYKYVTATGAQTYNATTANDSGVMVFAMIPDHILPVTTAGASTSTGAAPADLTTPLNVASTGASLSTGAAPADLTTPLQVTSTIVSLSTGAAPVNIANRLQITSTLVSLTTGAAPLDEISHSWVILSM